MRLWSIHPKYLDTKGLVALWREGLLAKKVLEGETEGYRNHPELDIFKCEEDPCACIDAFLFCVWEEADNRGYSFDKDKINEVLTNQKILISKDQAMFEFEHLKSKLKARDPKKYGELVEIKEPELNPLFVCEG